MIDLTKGEHTLALSISQWQDRTQQEPKRDFVTDRLEAISFEELDSVTLLLIQKTSPTNIYGSAYSPTRPHWLFQFRNPETPQ